MANSILKQQIFVPLLVAFYLLLVVFYLLLVAFSLYLKKEKVCSYPQLLYYLCPADNKIGITFSSVRKSNVNTCPCEKLITSINNIFFLLTVCALETKKFYHR